MERLGLAQQVWRISAERLQSGSQLTGPSSTYRHGASMAQEGNAMPSTGSILIVDQEPTIVDLLVELLTDEGYVVYSAPAGTRALGAIARHTPALLLLDVRMPGLHSAALIAQVRQVGLATTPIVLMTTAPRDAAALLRPGSIECLAKPFDLDDLLVCVARHVQLTQAVDQSLALGAT
jgi:DNA-binding NtrC family response regulator